MDNQRYNVLFIQTDQWSQNFMGYRGCSEIMTPTIDQLARDGVIYTNCYSTCPVCIPARRSLMTGMSPRSHGDRVYSDRMKMPEAENTGPGIFGCRISDCGSGKASCVSPEKPYWF